MFLSSPKKTNLCTRSSTLSWPNRTDWRFSPPKLKILSHYYEYFFLLRLSKLPYPKSVKLFSFVQASDNLNNKKKVNKLLQHHAKWMTFTVSLYLIQVYDLSRTLRGKKQRIRKVQRLWVLLGVRKVELVGAGDGESVSKVQSNNFVASYTVCIHWSHLMESSMETE